MENKAMPRFVGGGGVSASYGKAEAKGTNSSRRKFSSILSEVTNAQQKEDEMKDSFVAIETQCRDAVDLAAEWIREECDEKLAKKMEKDLVEEAKLARALEISSGEAEALNVAIEERRRLQREAKEKKEREKRDEEMAREADDKESSIVTACEKDQDYAKSVHDLLQDEMLAEELAKAEEKQAEAKRRELDEVAQADAKFAACELLKEMEAKSAKREREEKDDLAFATKAQQELDAQSLKQKNEQEKKDERLAKTVYMRSMREEHRRKKRVEALAKHHFASLQDVATQWEDAEAQVDDVCGGICITLVLPFMRELKVNALGKNKVNLDATRVVSKAEQLTSLATTDNTQYSAEFIIEGNKIALSEKDISYEYESETGLLHVYVENVHLDHDANNSSSKYEVDEEEEASSSKKSSGKSSSSSSSGGGGIFKSLTRGFKKLIGAK